MDFLIFLPILDRKYSFEYSLIRADINEISVSLTLMALKYVEASNKARYDTTGSQSSLYEPCKQRNMASNYQGSYGIFYKISMGVVISENSQ